MKKAFYIIIILVTALVTYAIPALAEAPWISIGYNDSYAMSMAIGGRNQADFGFELGLTTNGKYGDANDYPCPHDLYFIETGEDHDYSIGLDALWFPGGNQFYVGGGIYFAGERVISRSTVTGWYYVEDEKLLVLIPLSAGVKFSTSNGGSIGLGYHTVRGANLSFSFMF